MLPVPITSAGGAPCQAGTDTIMTLFNADDRQLAQNDDTNGRGLCSQIAGNIDPGVYTIRITGFNDQAVAPYRLTVQVEPL